MGVRVVVGVYSLSIYTHYGAYVTWVRGTSEQTAFLRIWCAGARRGRAATLYTLMQGQFYTSYSSMQCKAVPARLVLTSSTLIKRS